jgi:hypothetical protein
MFLDVLSWSSLTASSWTAPSTPERLLRQMPTSGWSGPRAASPIASARSYFFPVSCPLPGTTGGRGMDAPKPTAGHPLGHPAGPPSKMDTLAWPAGRRKRTQGGRPPRPTACRTRSSGRLQSSIRASWPGVRMTNDSSPPWAEVWPGVRVGVQPSRSGASIPTAMVREMVKRLARQSPPRPCERPAWPHDVVRAGS